MLHDIINALFEHKTNCRQTYMYIHYTMLTSTPPRYKQTKNFFASMDLLKWIQKTKYSLLTSR